MSDNVENFQGFTPDVAGRSGSSTSSATTKVTDSGEGFSVSKWFSSLFASGDKDKKDKLTTNAEPETKAVSEGQSIKTRNLDDSDDKSSPLAAAEKSKIIVALNDRITKTDKIYRGYIEVASGSNYVIPVNSSMKRDGTRVPEEIFDDLKAAHEKYLPKRIERATAPYQLHDVDGVVVGLNESFIKFRTEQAYVETNKEIMAEVKKNHYARGRAQGISDEILDKELHGAFTLVDRATPSRGGMFGAITQAFYDPLKGGVQLGGVGGAALGFMLGSALAPEGSGWMGTAMKILMAVVGVYVGNSVVDYMKSKSEFMSEVKVDKVKKEETNADKEGKDKEGKDKEGKDKEGKDKEGKDKEGKDKEGKDKEGKSSASIFDSVSGKLSGLSGVHADDITSQPMQHAKLNGNSASAGVEI